MPKVTLTCRACGKKYTSCCTPNWGVFRWRDVACSHECFMEYMKQVEASRSETQDEKKTSEE